MEIIPWHTFGRISDMDVCFSGCVSGGHKEKRLGSVFLGDISTSEKPIRAYIKRRPCSLFSLLFLFPSPLLNPVVF